MRRHRLSERFLVDLLDMPWDAVHDEACKLEHALSPEVEARLAAQLGNPRTCPHGHVIPDEDGDARRGARSARCRRSTPATPATIGCVAEERPGPSALSRVARPAAGHRRRGRERRPVRRAAPRARRRGPVRARARDGGQDPGPRLTAKLRLPRVVSSPARPRLPARRRCRLPCRQPQRRQVVALQQPDR